jgi:hypothetical protein
MIQGKNSRQVSTVNSWLLKDYWRGLDNRLKKFLDPANPLTGGARYDVDTHGTYLYEPLTYIPFQKRSIL